MSKYNKSKHFIIYSETKTHNYSKSWYLSKRVTQNMLRTREIKKIFSENDFEFMTLSKYL